MARHITELRSSDKEHLAVTPINGHLPLRRGGEKDANHIGSKKNQRNIGQKLVNRFIVNMFYMSLIN
jgi:hypothetical protein